MNYPYPIYHSIFIIWMMMHIHIQNYAQGDALVLNFDCDTKCIDLKINGGFQPYDVEWQRMVNGIWVTQTNWPKSGLNGLDGSEDLCKIKALGTTEFKVIVTDALCGTAEQTITVQPCESVPCDGLSISVETYTNVSECGGWDDVIPPPTPYDNCDGSIMISVNGATGPYTVQWSNGATGTSIAGLCTGTYTVTVSQGNCTITQTFETCCCGSSTPKQGPYPHCDSSGNTTIESEISSPSTGTSVDGSIQLISPNGNNVKYKWEGPNSYKNNTQIISGLKVGTYCVTVSSGCSIPISECYTLVDCSQVNISVQGSITNTCQGYSLGIISASASGSIGPYKYKWTTGALTTNISNLSQGQYCVTITDKNGCKASKCFNVGLNELVTTRNGCVFTTTCNGNTVIQNNIGSYTVTRYNDCRYRDTYCSDGYYLGSNFAGTYYIKRPGGCTIDEYCVSNNQVYKVHNGVQETQFFGPSWNNNRECWWCHFISYCKYPTLNNYIDPSSVTMQNYFTYSFFMQNKSCVTERFPNACVVKIYCQGSLIWEGCSPFCSERACSQNDLQIKYDIFETPFYKDGEEGINVQYKITSFDTLALVKQLQLGNSIFEDESKISNRDSFNLETQKFILSKNGFYSIFPNPAYDFVTISIINENNSQNFDYNIYFYNFTGEIVKSLKIKNQYSEKLDEEISIQDLPSGPYKIVLRRNNHIIFEKTIIKI